MQVLQEQHKYALGSRFLLLNFLKRELLVTDGKIIVIAPHVFP